MLRKELLLWTFFKSICARFSSAYMFGKYIKNKIKWTFLRIFGKKFSYSEWPKERWCPVGEKIDFLVGTYCWTQKLAQVIGSCIRVWNQNKTEKKLSM